MKDNLKKTATIFDVARHAGVSRGTVDRVVYGRGRVSQATIEKVQRAIEALGYKANPNASQLASKREYTFYTLTPQFKAGEYWAVIDQGFAEAAKSLSMNNIRIKRLYYNQTDVASLNECFETILAEKPSGVIMNVVFKEAVAEFAAQLNEQGVPFAFIDNKIDQCDYMLYYGVDAYQSGMLGAFLLTTRLDVREILLVRLIRDAKHKADPNALRRHGFLDYIEENLPDCVVHTLFIHPDSAERTYAALEEFFDAHPTVKHIAMTNSRVYLIGEYLRRNPDAERSVVGFDDLERNLECLRNGEVEYLVTRHIPMQSFNALMIFVECVTKGTLPNHRNNYVHMDILHRRNMDHY